MDRTLTFKLLEKKLINENTEVTASYNAAGIAGDMVIKSTGVFTVSSIGPANDNNDITFNVISTRDGHKRLITQRDILEIDGMTPVRFAAVYDIKADGKAATVGKRRGRKPKDRSQAQA